MEAESGLEAVSKVNVQNLARHPVQQEVGGMPVAQAQDVTHHGDDGQGPGEVGPPVEPDLT